MRNDKWTTENIPDLTGKVIIVTGGNSGLGFESVKAFAEKGAEVILACRSVEKGKKAKSEIDSGNIKGNITVKELDLQDFGSIEKFAEGIHKKHSKIDVLLNNAGIMGTPYFLTGEGLEGQMGVNHFGPYMLTGLLLDLIIKTPKSRVVNVSSGAHRFGKMDFSNLLYENGKQYAPMKAYNRSKLSNLLFTYELQRKFEEHKIDTIVVGAHPGAAISDLTRHTPVIKFLLPVIAQTTARGALPQIRACVGIDVKGGDFYGPHKMATGFPVSIISSKGSHNKEDAKKLWDISEQITKVKYFN
ncbi:MAG: oxidoreductase [Leptospirales bacterium]